MAIYVKGNETKKRIILYTYNKLREQEASTFTARGIAKDCGCSAAALYRHFDSLDYLLVVASIRFLDDYLTEYARILDSGDDILKIYLDGWKLFNSYAFDRPDIYYPLFWGEKNSVFSSAFQDYFELFPFDGSSEYTALYYTLLFNNDMQERDTVMLRRVENAGYLHGREVEFYSWSNTLIVRGLIQEAIGCSEEERSKKRKLCSWLIVTNMKEVLERNHFSYE